MCTRNVYKTCVQDTCTDMCTRHMYKTCTDMDRHLHRYAHRCVKKTCVQTRLYTCPFSKLPHIQAIRANILVNTASAGEPSVPRSMPNGAAYTDGATDSRSST